MIPKLYWHGRVERSLFLASENLIQECYCDRVTRTIAKQAHYLLGQKYWSEMVAGTRNCKMTDLNVLDSIIVDGRL